VDVGGGEDVEEEDDEEDEDEEDEELKVDEELEDPRTGTEIPIPRGSEEVAEGLADLVTLALGAPEFEAEAEGVPLTALLVGLLGSFPISTTGLLGVGRALTMSSLLSAPARFLIIRACAPMLLASTGVTNVVQRAARSARV